MTNVKKLFFASTDCVYGENGEIPLLKESSPLKPVNVYGQQKMEAENIVLSKGFTVTRLPFMFGPSMSSKNSFYDNLCKRLKNGEEIEMIDGMLRSALKYSETAELLVKLSKKDNLPIFRDKQISLIKNKTCAPQAEGRRFYQEITVYFFILSRISRKRAACSRTFA
jgi:nucleoside-diphosphate-sugar epimerase